MDRSGIITGDETWSGDIRLTGDVLVPAGMTLTIEPGTRITFASGSDCDLPEKEEAASFLNTLDWLEGPVEGRGRCCLVVCGTLNAAGEPGREIAIGGEGWNGGIIVRSKRPFTLRHSRITHASFGLFHDGRSSVMSEVSGCEFSDNRCALVGSRRIHIAGNTFRDNGAGVVLVRGSNGPVGFVRDNRFVRSGKHAVVCNRGTITVERNRIEGSDSGISIVSCFAAAVRENAVSGARIGLFAATVDYLDVIRNRFEHSSEGAIVTGRWIGKARICDNTITEAACGIDCRGSVNAEVRANAVSGGYGLRLWDQAKGIIERNRLEDCNNAAIICDGLSEAVIRENRILFPHGGTGSIGIGFREESSGIVERNRIEGSGRGIGVSLTGMGRVDFAGNDIRGVNVPVFAGAYRERAPAAAPLPRGGDDADRATVGGDLIRGGGLRGFVLATWHMPVFGRAYRTVYRLAVRVVEAAFSQIAGIRSVYLRRGLTGNDWIPGSSDIDLLAVLDGAAGEADERTTDSILRRYRRLKRLFPMLGELQVTTVREARNYLEFGDLRAHEAQASWRLLRGEELRNGSPCRRDPDKLRCDAAAEVLSAYRACCSVFFERTGYVNAKQLFVKSWIDVLRYGRVFERGTAEMRGSRAGFLADRLGERPGAAERELLEKILRAWTANGDLEDADYARAYLFLLGTIDRLLSGWDPEGPAPGRGDVVPILDETCRPPSGPAFGAFEWEQFMRSLTVNGEGIVRSIVVDDPGLCYLILEDGALERPDFAIRTGQVVGHLKAEVNTWRTPFVVVTGNMFRAMLLCLHLETPFGYFRLQQGKGFAVEGGQADVRRQYRVDLDDYRAPAGPLLALLVREAVTVVSLMLRTFPETSRLTNREMLVYLYTRVLGLRLAFEQGIVAPPFLEGAAECYRKHFPEHGPRLEEALRRYVAGPAREVNRMDREAVFRENRRFLEEILGGLNALLERQIPPR